MSWKPKHKTKAEFLAVHFPEYLVNGVVPGLQRRYFRVIRLAGSRGTAETHPWAYANAAGLKVNWKRGYYWQRDGRKYARVYLTEDQYNEHWQELNYYRNGGKVPFTDLPGLDPAKLRGGYRAARSDSYICDAGVYTPRHRKKIQKDVGWERVWVPARFDYYDGRKNPWVGANY